MMKLTNSELLELSDQIQKTTQGIDDYFNEINESHIPAPSFLTDEQESFKKIATLLCLLSSATDLGTIKDLEKQLVIALIDHHQTMDMRTGTAIDIMLIEETSNYVANHMPSQLRNSSNHVNSALYRLGNELITSYLNSPTLITIHAATIAKAEKKLKEEGIDHIAKPVVSIKTISSWCRLFNHRDPLPEDLGNLKTTFKL